MKRLFALILSLSIGATPSIAIAGPDEDMRDAALTEAKKLRSDGWPNDRCYLGIRFNETTAIRGNGNIIAGDRIIKIGSRNVEPAGPNNISAILEGIEPSSIIDVKLNRSGNIIDVRQQCESTSDFQSTYLKALDLAGKKKWYECIDTLQDQKYDWIYLGLRVRCARVSRKAEEYPIQQWTDKIMQNAIADGFFMRNEWPQVADRLLKARIELTPAVYEDLAKEVISWDGGQTWNGVQPDNTILRRAAERGVRNRLIDPQSAIIEMPYDFIYGAWTPAYSGTSFQGFMTCGTVNAKNRMGGYTGSTFFISVVDESGFEKITDMDNATSEYFRPIDNTCANLIPKLKFNVNIVERMPITSAAPTTSSVAEELEKLAQLHASGALNDEEYATAKSRVLSNH